MSSVNAYHRLLVSLGLMASSSAARDWPFYPLTLQGGNGLEISFYLPLCEFNPLLEAFDNAVVLRLEQKKLRIHESASRHEFIEAAVFPNQDHGAGRGVQVIMDRTLQPSVPAGSVAASTSPSMSSGSPRVLSRRRRFPELDRVRLKEYTTVSSAKNIARIDLTQKPLSYRRLLHIFELAHQALGSYDPFGHNCFVLADVITRAVEIVSEVRAKRYRDPAPRIEDPALRSDDQGAFVEGFGTCLGFQPVGPKDDDWIYSHIINPLHILEAQGSSSGSGPGSAQGDQHPDRRDPRHKFCFCM